MRLLRPTPEDWIQHVALLPDETLSDREAKVLVWLRQTRTAGNYIVSGGPWDVFLRAMADELLHDLRKRSSLTKAAK